VQNVTKLHSSEKVVKNFEIGEECMVEKIFTTSNGTR
jgi:hypothetical protein